MKIFKNRDQYASQSQNDYSPQNLDSPSIRAMQPAASSQNGLPKVGSYGIFTDTTDIGPYGAMKCSSITEIRNNRFFDEDGNAYKYFAYVSQSSPEVFQVAFGSTVCRKKVPVSNVPAPSRNTDVPRCTGVIPEASNDSPVLIIDRTYLFTNDPKAGFVKGIFVSPSANGKTFVANIGGREREFVFAITMADYESGRKERLICACDPRELQQSMPMSPGRTQQSSRQPNKEDNLQSGQEVYAFDTLYGPAIKTEFITVDNAGFSTPDGTFRYVIPADMVKGGDIEAAKKFYLAVRNGEIYAPNFQR